MMNEEIRHFMSKNPISVQPNDTLSTALSLLKSSRVHHLPVVDSRNVLVGMLTYDNLWPYESSPDIKIDQIMTRSVVKITPVDKVGTAAELFLDKRFKALPVVNLRGELKGMVTSYDILKYAFKKEYKVPILYKEVFAETA